MFAIIEFYTVKSSRNYVTIKPCGLYSYVSSFNMLRLIVVYDGLFEILHHDFVGNSGKEFLKLVVTSGFTVNGSMLTV